MGKAGKWSVGSSEGAEEVAQGGIHGHILVGGGGSALDENVIGEASVTQLSSSVAQKAEHRPPLRPGEEELPAPQGEMPSKQAVQGTAREVQPLIKGAGPVVVVEAASKLGEVAAASTKYYKSVDGEKVREEKGREEEKKGLSPFVQQLLAASGPVMATVSSGMTSGFSAVLLPQLTAVNSTFPISEEEGSWIASTAALPMAPGCLLGGLLMEKIGRRLTIILLCIPFALGWALESAAPDVLSLCLGRALTGLAVGLLGAPGMVYIGETSSPAHRGFLLAAVSLAVSVGVGLSHLVGALLPWRTAAGVAACVPLLAAVLSFISPESPLWLASQGRIREAAQVFRMLRGTSLEAEKELEALVSRGTEEEVRLQDFSTGVESGMETAVVEETPSAAAALAKWMRQWSLLLRRPSFLKPFFIMNLFFFVQQWCGVNAVTFYTVDIFKATAKGSSGGVSVDEYTATGLVDAARVVASVAACVLLRKCGRRPLATASGLVSAVSLLALAAFLTFGAPSENLQNGNRTSLLSAAPENSSSEILSLANIFDNSTALPTDDALTFVEEAMDAAAYAWAWAPVVCLVIYVLASSVGLIPLPWVMTGEVFPVAGRGLGSGVTSCVGFLAFFSVVKTAPALFRALGVGGAFCVYGAVVLVGTGLLHLCLPETKGRTLREIEESFGGFGKKEEEAASGGEVGVGERGGGGGS